MNRMFVRNNVTHKHFPVKPVAATVFIINTRQTSCGNVFTQVCVSVCPQQRSLPMMPLVSHMPPPPDMFKLVHLRDSPCPHGDPTRHVHTCSLCVPDIYQQVDSWPSTEMSSCYRMFWLGCGFAIQYHMCHLV